MTARHRQTRQSGTGPDSQSRPATAAEAQYQCEDATKGQQTCRHLHDKEQTGNDDSQEERGATETPEGKIQEGCFSRRLQSAALMLALFSSFRYRAAFTREGQMKSCFCQVVSKSPMHVTGHDRGAQTRRLNDLVFIRVGIREPLLLPPKGSNVSRVRLHSSRLTKADLSRHQSLRPGPVMRVSGEILGAVTS